MAELLQIGSRTIHDTEIIPILAQYQMLPNLCREIIIDQAINSIDCTETEVNSAVELFCQKNQITSDQQLQLWLQHHSITSEQFPAIATRELKLEKFKQATWGHKLESYFLTRKGQLDKVIYSLIRTNDVGIAQELYFRLEEGEQSFAELAKEYSQGPEAQTGGLVGPVELSTPHPALVQLLSTYKPGQLCPPLRLGEWMVIVRLEKFMPAQLDDAMRQRLLNELCANWLQEQLQQVLPIHSKITASVI